MTRATRLRGSGLWRRAAAFAAGYLRSRSAHFSWPGEPARAGARRSGARSVGVARVHSRRLIARVQAAHHARHRDPTLAVGLLTVEEAVRGGSAALIAGTIACDAR